MKALKPPQLDTRQLAHVARHFEEIKDARGGTVTIRYVSLAEVMGKAGTVEFDLQCAASRYKELFLMAYEASSGVSAYGDYQPGTEPSQRALTTDRLVDARTSLHKATVAAFGTLTDESYANGNPKWVLDHELMQLVIPAIISDKKEVTQGAIANVRTRYTGPAQTRAAGGAIITETLNRLAMHFGYRTGRPRKKVLDKS